MNKIFLIDKKTLVKTETSDAKIVLDKATIVQTKLNASDVKEFIQEGNTLVIKLKNGEEIRIENYFSKEINGEQQSGLVLEDTECGFLSLVSEKGLLSLKEITGLEELLTSTTGVNLIPWLVGGAVTGGIIGAIDGGSSNGTSPKPLDAPTVEILTDENDDGLLSHKELGSKTAVDVAVSIPTGAKVGDTVTVTDQSGKKYSHVLSADDLSSGKVIVKVDVPAEGTELKVTATITNNGGESAPSNEDSAVVDTIPPTLTIIVPELGNDNTPTISGTSDAPEGSEVVITITDKDG
ncbi:BapA/Bap/LapF family prefix-like domain-containing protein, partial [Acinetobacter gerneri]